MLNNCFGNSEKTTFFIICTRYLFEGLESAIIMPTLNLFLLSLDNSSSNKNDESLSLGLALSAFNISTLIACPIFGYICDLTGSTKVAVIMGNVFKIGGNIMYCFAQNPFMVVASRFLVGIGYGPTPSMIGMLNQATPTQRRTHKISLIFLFRQLGSMIGPLCYFFLRLHALFFYIGSYYMNEFTMPTFFASILWVFHTVMVAFFYHDLPPVNINDNCSYDNVEEDHAQQNNDKLINENNFKYKQKLMENNKKEKWNYIYTFLRTLNNDIISETTIACLFTGFASTFVDSGLTGLVTPLSLQLFKWKELENNEYFVGLGFVTIISLVALGKLSQKASDEILIVVGESGLILSSLLLFIFSWCHSDSVLLLITFIVFGFFISMSYPFAYSPLLSLISKLTSERNKGFNLAVLSVFTNIGSIMGYIWTTSLVDSQMSIVAVVTLFISVVPWVMFVASFRRFRIRRNFVAVRHVSGCANERTPLLSHA